MNTNSKKKAAVEQASKNYLASTAQSAPTPRYRRASVKPMVVKAVDQSREVYDRSRPRSGRIGYDT